MNYFKTLLLGLFSFICFVTSAATLVVNNNPGAPTGAAVYATFAEAISVASNGDIIYLVPSSTSYGTFSVDKGVTIFGAGLIPDKDLGIKTFVDFIDIDASNVRLSGLTFNNELRLGYNITSTTISNITIENCRIDGIRHYNTGSVNIGNLLIRNNVITNSSYPIFLSTTSSVIITNNIIIVDRYDYNGINADGVTFSYNVFRYQGTTGNDGYVIENVDNSLFEYNIFHGARPVIPAGSINNNFNYNLCYGNLDNTFTGLGANGNSGTGNIIGDPLFVNVTLGSGWSDSYDFTPDTGSPALNIGSTGNDAGVSGGSTPWDSDGSLLPTVQSISIPSVIPLGTDLNVNVTGKGN